MGMQPPASTERPATAPLTERKAWSIPGVLALVAGLVALVVGIGLLVSAFTRSAGSNVAGGWAAILLLIAGLLAAWPDAGGGGRGPGGAAVRQVPGHGPGARPARG